MGIETDIKNITLLLAKGLTNKIKEIIVPTSKVEDILWTITKINSSDENNLRKNDM